MSDITHGTDINQGSWQERSDPGEINCESTFDLSVDDTHDDCSLFMRFLKVDPRFCTLRFFARQACGTKTVFNRVQGNLD